MSVPGAVRCAKAAGLIDIRRGENEINAVRVLRQAVGVDRVHDDPLHSFITKRGSARIIVRRAAAVIHAVRHMDVAAVIVSRIDVEVWRSTNILCEVFQYRVCGIATPVTVPNVIHKSRSRHHESAMIRDSIATLGSAAARMGILIL